LDSRASAEKFPERQRKKIPKNSKKDRKIALSTFCRGVQQKKTPKNSKKNTKNSTFKPLFSIFVPKGVGRKFSRGGGNGKKTDN